VLAPAARCLLDGPPRRVCLGAQAEHDFAIEKQKLVLEAKQSMEARARARASAGRPPLTHSCSLLRG
jgi:hypothetical protein